MKITPHNLITLGFRGEGKTLTNTPTYRLAIPNYQHEFQMELNDKLHEENPNYARLCLYKRAEKDEHVHVYDKVEDKPDIDFLEWEDEGNISGIKFMDFPQQVIPIAYGVTTLERLNQIYTALTQNEPLKPRIIEH